MPRPLSAEARDKTLAAAQEVLAVDGIEGFTVDAVAKRSGVAKTTIYRHFSSGNLLLLHAVDAMSQPIPTPNTGTLAGDIESLMLAGLEQLSDDAMRRVALGIMSAATTDPEMNRVHQDMINEKMTPIRTVLELARGRGDLHADLDLKLAADMIEGPFFFRALILNEPFEANDVSALASFIAHSLVAAFPPDAPLP